MTHEETIADMAHNLIAPIFLDWRTGVGGHAVRALAEDGAVFNVDIH
jgi:hypothetical protein